MGRRRKSEEWEGGGREGGLFLRFLAPHKCIRGGERGRGGRRTITAAAAAAANGQGEEGDEAGGRQDGNGGKGKGKRIEREGQKQFVFLLPTFSFSADAAKRCFPCTVRTPSEGGRASLELRAEYHVVVDQETQAKLLVRSFPSFSPLFSEERPLRSSATVACRHQP